MKKILLFFLTIINILIFTPNYVIANAEDSVSDNVIINQSVDDDLKEFNFDYTRYILPIEKYYQPVMINFNESLSNDYYDLIYFYNPYDIQVIQAVDVSIFVGNDINNLSKLKDITYILNYTGISSDGVRRYAIDGFEDYRFNYNYRKYQFNSVDVVFPLKNPNGIVIGSRRYTYELNNAYQFQFNSPIFEYSNCINLVLEDAHCWSWHFDEDNGWENFWEWLGRNRTDVLKDQLFYSFYIDNWNVKELKSIDLQYKKVLLEGCRYNVADTGTSSEFYDNADDPYYAPKFYKWNDSNNSESLDKSTLLGNSKTSIASKLSYTKDTITPTSKTSTGVQHQYTWDTIMNINEFKTQFGEDSEIYKFASGYFNEDEKYWIINFDEFYYSYNSDTMRTSGDEYLESYSDDFENYLKENGINELVYSDSSRDYYYYYDYYTFTQECVFDMRALELTFEDAMGAEYTLPTSVASVDEEASGGTSEFFMPTGDYDWWKDLLRILAIVLLVVAVIVLWPVIKIIINLIVTLVKNISNSINSKKNRKNEKKNE